MKKYAGIIAAALAISAFALPAHAEQTISVVVDGMQLQSDTPAQIVNGRTLVPMRVIFESLDADVQWDADTKTVIADRGADHIEMAIGAPSFAKNADIIELDTPAQIIDGRTMVPVRAISESLGCEVLWIADGKTVVIQSSSSGPVTPDTTVGTTTEATTEVSTETTTEAAIFAPDTEYIAKTAANMKPPKAFDKNYTNDEWYNIHCEIRAYFESELAALIYGDNSAVYDMLTNKGEFEKAVKTYWDMMCDDFFRSAGLESDEDVRKYIEKTCLTFDANINVYTGELEDGVALGVLALAEDYSQEGARYFAVLSDSEGNVGLYSAEPDEQSRDYMVCVIGDSLKGRYDKTIKENEMAVPEKFLVIVDEMIHLD